MASLDFLLASLDRCEHGRHQADWCAECGDVHQPNDLLDNQVGYGLDGYPITGRALLVAWERERQPKPKHASDCRITAYYHLPGNYIYSEEPACSCGATA